MWFKFTILLQLLLEDKGYNRFTSAEFSLVGRFSTEVWQVKLVGSETVLILKKPYQIDRTGESADLEALFYEFISPRLPVDVPPYIGLIDDIVILELVPDLEPFDFKLGPQGRHAELAIEGFARLHAATLGDATEFDWLPLLADNKLRSLFQADFDLGWQKNRQKLDEICPAFTDIGDALVGHLASTLEGLAAPQCLLHGDGHAENLPITSDATVIFLDWQSPRIGNPGSRQRSG